MMNSCIFPYEEKITYYPKKDAFDSLVILSFDSTTYGYIDVEIGLRKSYHQKTWRLDSLHSFSSPLTKGEENQLREQFEQDGLGLLGTLQEEEEYIKQKYTVSSIEIQEIESIQELNDNNHKYYEELWVKLSSKLVFRVFVKKVSFGQRIKIEICPIIYSTSALKNLCYPGWRSEFEEMVRSYWVNKQSALIDPLTKRALAYA